MTVSFPGSGNPDILGPDSYEDHHSAVPRSRLDSVYGDYHSPLSVSPTMVCPLGHTPILHSPIPPPLIPPPPRQV